jgi:predicted metal-binding membrane protein
MRRTTVKGAASTAPAVAVTLGLAAASWVVPVRQMDGMHMGVGTELGPFASFIGLWVVMMAAMMLPGALPTVLRRRDAGGGVRTAPAFVGSYVAVWALVGVGVYAVYRPHGTLAAGVVAIAAGLYELTPIKRHFRQGCRERAGSGFSFGAYCVGSSIGLMLLLVALGVMSVGWMAMVAVLVLVQKLLPPRAPVDLPVGFAIVGLGVVIVLAPSSVPGLMPPM